MITVGRMIVHSLHYKYYFDDEHGEGECSFTITQGVISVFENKRIPDAK